MPVSQFPTKFNSDYPLEPDGPIHLILQDVKPELPALFVKQMKGGGASYSLQSSRLVLRWDITYSGLTRDQVQPLDDHYLEAQDQFGAFDFRHQRTGILYSNVHYELYDYPPHEHVDCQSRHIVLIKRPPQNDPGAILGENGDFMLSETGFHILQQN